ncbi:MAG TPA: phosphotransferase family protein [Acidimicrobiales bacterium]|nr:phosphotransferase family protein [Acidimicrobiales bacterium]
MDRDRLAAWLRVPAESVRIEQLSGGSSNLTYLVEADGDRLVLRRPPLSHVLATAHDVGREYRVQSALGAATACDVPVPRMVAWCDDESVIGAPFYVMEWLDGVVYADANAVAHLSDGDARAATDRLVDVLVALHAVDVDAVGLGDLGRRRGFVARQVARWRTQWSRSRADGPSVVDDVGDRLGRWAEGLTDDASTLVHGDFSFNNTLWSRTAPAELLAVLDWEMATLGDPLTDLGMLTAYWGRAGELMWRNRAPQAHRANTGFPPAEVLVDRYVAGSGRDAVDLGHYEALAVYKLAVIVAGAAARLAGQGAADRAASARTLTEELATLALDLSR